MTRRAGGPWYYEQIELGFNYRMTDIQAALGLSQLQRLDEFVAAATSWRGATTRCCAGCRCGCPRIQPANLSAFHLYVVRLRPAQRARAHRQVFERMRAAGIGVNLHYIPVHLQPYYRALGFAAGQFPEAEAHGREAITLPLFAGLTESQQDRVVDCLRQALGTTT